MSEQKAPVECRLKKNTTIVRIFWLKVGEQTPNKDWERVPENVLDEFYKSGKTRSQSIFNRRS